MKRVKKNQKLNNPDSPLLIGEVKENDVIKEVNDTHEKIVLFKHIFNQFYFCNLPCL